MISSCGHNAPVSFPFWPLEVLVCCLLFFRGGLVFFPGALFKIFWQLHASFACNCKQSSYNLHASWMLPASCMHVACNCVQLVRRCVNALRGIAQKAHGVLMKRKLHGSYRPPRHGTLLTLHHIISTGTYGDAQSSNPSQQRPIRTLMTFCRA